MTVSRRIPFVRMLMLLLRTATTRKRTTKTKTSSCPKNSLFQHPNIPWRDPRFQAPFETWPFTHRRTCWQLPRKMPPPVWSTRLPVTPSCQMSSCSKKLPNIMTSVVSEVFPSPRTALCSLPWRWMDGSVCGNKISSNSGLCSNAKPPLVSPKRIWESIWDRIRPIAAVDLLFFWEILKMLLPS